MRHLTAYVDDINTWGSFFNQPEITFPLDQKACDELARRLDCDLSPENLHCDGELGMVEVDRKYRFYSKVYEELNAYCNLNRLTTPAVYEL